MLGSTLRKLSIIVKASNKSHGIGYLNYYNSLRKLHKVLWKASEPDIIKLQQMEG